MTFEQYYKIVSELSGIISDSKYVRILWDNAYTIDQAVYNLQTMRDEA